MFVLAAMAREDSDMRFESARLSTFRDWPSQDKVDAGKIAKAGFHHTGPDAVVRCSWCGCTLSDWNYGDQVMSRHRLASPNCPFVRSQSDNVPISESHIRTAHLSSPLQNNVRGDSETDHSGSERTVDEHHMDASEDSTGMGSNQLFDLHPGAFSMFKRESNRLRTFSGWTANDVVLPADLAKAGFVYTGRRDCVRCVYCGEYVGEWAAGDVPEAEHRSLFPHCPFMRGQDVGNVPIGSEDEAATQSTFRFDAGSADETGIRSRLSLGSGPEKGPSVVQWKMQQTVGCSRDANALESSGIVGHSGPFHPKYSTVESRLRTFRDWPPALKQKPEELAEAGFYYIGLSDQVKCFYCDGGLRNWQSDDEPWTEHSRWFSRLVKGDDFIARCLAERPTSSSTSETAETATKMYPTIVEKQPETTTLSSETILRPTKDISGGTILSSDLEKENRALKEQRTCKICMDREIGVVFLPCGHLICCVLCAPALKDCPLCRQHIQGTVKAYMS